MTERLFGIETEYALTAAAEDGLKPDVDAHQHRLMAIAERQLPHLNADGKGIFLQNGSKFLIDCGGHPEMAIPECANPWDVVRYVLAGERILAGLTWDPLQPRAGLLPATFLKCNVDYGGNRTTWGCHESYLHTVDPSQLPRYVIPHLVSRVVYTGAGGFDPRSTGVQFILSPRSCYLMKAVSGESMSDRGLFHTKNESLCRNGYGRLHVLVGESLCSHTGMWLKTAATALIVAMIEGGVCPSDTVALADPVDALHTIANDVTCTATVLKADGSRATALAIQRLYLAQAEAHQHARFMPPWAPEACARWRHVLDLLEHAPEAVETTLDWAIKRALFVRHAERRRIQWETLPRWTHVAATADAERMGAEHGGSPGSREFRRFLNLRTELFEIDMRFGQIGGGAPGVFAALDKAGVLTHQVPGVDNVEHAIENPPAIGRAQLRGRMVRQLAPNSGRYLCGWTGIIDRQDGCLLDLNDPFETAERWQPQQSSRASESFREVAERLARDLRRPAE